MNGRARQAGRFSVALVSLDSMVFPGAAFIDTFASTRGITTPLSVVQTINIEMDLLQSSEQSAANAVLCVSPQRLDKSTDSSVVMQGNDFDPAGMISFHVTSVRSAGSKPGSRGGESRNAASPSIAVCQGTTAFHTDPPFSEQKHMIHKSLLILSTGQRSCALELQVIFAHSMHWCGR
jgi:hypothetical protein